VQIGMARWKTGNRKKKDNETLSFSFSGDSFLEFVKRSASGKQKRIHAARHLNNNITWLYSKELGAYLLDRVNSLLANHTFVLRPNKRT